MSNCCLCGPACFFLSASIVRVFWVSGPAFGGRWLYWERRECGSIAFCKDGEGKVTYVIPPLAHRLPCPRSRPRIDSTSSLSTDVSSQTNSTGPSTDRHGGRGQ